MLEEKLLEVIKNMFTVLTHLIDKNMPVEFFEELNLPKFQMLLNFLKNEEFIVIVKGSDDPYLKITPKGKRFIEDLIMLKENL
ncbi:hypothetical protein DRO51_03625 [Candidatus Bathyarchaeota archaeon]|nr:MAG: hypothetical protein DRO51_03625 [Candidatus Bathyarchaeota archaeon]